MPLNSIKSSFRAVIRRNKLVYHGLLWLCKCFWAVRAVRLDVSSLREFAAWTKGGQDLGGNNYRFYQNFFSGITLSADRQLHFIDVGANDGWFARVIMRFAPAAQITSYEPLLSQHPRLENLQHKHPTFHFRKKAVGDQCGSLTITEYGTSGLSSLKEISPTYEYPSDHYSQSVVNKYSVQIARLDDELSEVLAGQTNGELILKIDTQGFELEVLRGAEHCLRQGVFKYIIVELMTVEKYAGGHLYDEIFGFLHRHGYRLWDVNTTYYEAGSGRLTEFDAIFESSIPTHSERTHGKPE